MFRQIEPLIEQYTHYGKPNFSIWSGRNMHIAYDGGNLEEGEGELRRFLNQIKASGTQTTFVLKVYDEGVKNVRSDSGYGGSFSFMLDESAPVVQGQNGLMVIDREATRPASAVQLKAWEDKQSRMEDQIRELNEKLYNARLDAMSKDFNNKISGLQTAAAKPTMEENIMGMVSKVIEQPDIITKFFEGIKNLISEFRAPAKPAVSGTKTTHMEEEQIETETDDLSQEDRGHIANIYVSINTIAEKIGWAEMDRAMAEIAKMGEKKLKGFMLML